MQLANLKQTNKGSVQMKIGKNLKEKITEAAETIYDVSKKDVKVDVSKKGLSVQEKRPTRQRIKWQAKIR
ncbi:hypothetical protein GCM10019998_23960 [Tetragenococcus solitarius]|uniref:Uncharacterized protein n=2 Tax=Tetragenococcus solitarius TaxID=71453 RepID=A0ABP6L282_9ENTE